MHSHAPAEFGRAFAIGIALNLGFVVVEAPTASSPIRWRCLPTPATTSPTCSASLIAWGERAREAAADARFTYGLRGTSILAALVNALFLLVATGAIAWEAVGRFDPLPSPGRR